MISASNDTQQQEALIEKYMQLPNQVWDDIINQAAKNVDVLKDHEAVKQLGSILKTNVRACKGKWPLLFLEVLNFQLQEN